MKKVLLSLMAAGLLLASFATVVLARPPVDLTPELKAARAATAKYNAVTKALADGYVSTVECVSSPPLPGNLGGMGFHYGNFGLIDPFVDPLTPEVLLYEPIENRVRLVAVEYIGIGPQVLFGQTFEPGPFPGSSALHVWLFKENPSGIFADFNPNVSCS